jgi:radical SAM superfamily enzyme YgiQ (UPF0313 family)
LPDRIPVERLSVLLKKANHPARYIGAEVGATNKSFHDSTVRIALAFPDLYEVGISNLGLKIIYSAVNAVESLMADRVYAPDKDFKAQLQDNKLPLYGLESRMPLKAFDVVAFSLQYELNYTTMLAMMDLADIPKLAKDRSHQDPIIFAGGPSSFNPEPVANFLDAILPGDGEEVVIEFLKTIQDAKKDPSFSRDDLLKKLF